MPNPNKMLGHDKENKPKKLMGKIGESRMNKKLTKSFREDRTTDYSGVVVDTQTM